MSRRPRHILRISLVNKCIRDLPAVLHVLQDERNRDAWLFELSRLLWLMCYCWCLNEKSSFSTRVVVNKSITLQSILIILSIIEQLNHPKLIICNM